MPRPRTPIGSHGNVTVQHLADGKWRARTRYRHDNGTLRQIERFAPTKAAARLSLQIALIEINPSTGDVRREMHLDELADRFLESKTSRAPRTVDTYRQTIEHHIKPKIGNLAVSEATTDRLGRFIHTIQTEHGPGAAKGCRAVLSGMMGLAARSDAIRVNPVREIAHIERHTQGATAIPLDQLPEILRAVRADPRLNELDIVDLIEVLAATGCRVGEACALLWEDIDLDNERITIHANIVRARGLGLIRQSHAKTRAGDRTIAIPTGLVDVLRRRLNRPEWINPDRLVFPTVLGNLRDPRNTSRDWADARARVGFPTVTTHSFRKTVATALDMAGLSAREIAEYLGHENPSLTQDVYMAKNTGGTKAARALQEALSKSR